MILKKNYYFDILILFLIFIFDRFSKIYVIYLSEKNNYSQIFSKRTLLTSINICRHEKKKTSGLGHKCPFIVVSRLGSRQRAGSGSSAGGSASGLGPEGRRFESCLPDKKHTSCTAK